MRPNNIKARLHRLLVAIAVATEHSQLRDWFETTCMAYNASMNPQELNIR